MLPFVSPSRRHSSSIIACILAMVLCGTGLTAMGAQGPAGRSTAAAGRVTITVEAGAPVDATALAESHARAIADAWTQFTALFAPDPATPQFIAFVNDLDGAGAGIVGMRPITDFAFTSIDGSVTVIAIEPFLQLTPVEAANMLRNAVSRGFIQAAAGGKMPPGLLDGIARYVELPVVARQARLGSLVQGQDQAGTLPGWDAIVDASSVAEITPEMQAANAYALVAFLTDRYGVAGLRDLVAGFATTPDWPANLAATFGQTEAELASAWEQFLPRWFASGWRDNAVSAFDLGRAETLFARGAYEAAAAEAERSQRLFVDLDDQAGLSQVEALLAQCALGLQADRLMADAQAALEAHEYANARDLIAQADELYVLLPEAHRPGSTIDRYSQLAATGIIAGEHLEQSRTEADGWLTMRGARANALAAGDGFASLGDADGLAEAQGVVSAIDTRIQRLVYVLSALVIALGAWLAAWLWQRAPGRLRWQVTRVPGARRAGAGG